MESYERLRDGCQWSRSCFACRWPDCQLDGNRHRFWSSEAVTIRAAEAFRLRYNDHLGLGDIAELFGIKPRSVKRYLSLSGGYHTVKAERDRRIREAARLNPGATRRELASMFGVSSGTVGWAVGDQVHTTYSTHLIIYLSWPVRHF